MEEIEVSVDLTWKSSFRDIQRRIHSRIDNIGSIENITFGCSFTNGHHPLKTSETWFAMLAMETNIEFLNASRMGAGFFQLAESELKIIKNVVDTSRIKHVVVQAPSCLRYPWYCDRKKYVRKISIQKFFKMSDNNQNRVLKKIFKQEAAILDDITSSFPNARIAFWRYWFNELNSKLKTYGEQMSEFMNKSGATCLDILPNEIVEDLRPHINTDKNDWQVLRQPYLYEKGYVIDPNDTHPSKKYNEFVKDQVKKWIK